MAGGGNTCVRCDESCTCRARLMTETVTGSWRTLWTGLPRRLPERLPVDGSLSREDSKCRTARRQAGSRAEERRKERATEADDPKWIGEGRGGTSSHGGLSMEGWRCGSFMTDATSRLPCERAPAATLPQSMRPRPPASRVDSRRCSAERPTRSMRATRGRPGSWCRRRRRWDGSSKRRHRSSRARA